MIAEHEHVALPNAPAQTESPALAPSPPDTPTLQPESPILASPGRAPVSPELALSQPELASSPSGLAVLPVPSSILATPPIIRPSPILAPSLEMQVEVVPSVVEVVPSVVASGVPGPTSPHVSEADSISTMGDKDRTVERLVEVAGQLGKVYDFTDLSKFISAVSVKFQSSGLPPPKVHESTCSWNQHYSVLSFLVNGHLHADYVRLAAWLGLPPCGNSQWQRILTKLEPHVTKLAEWSCSRATVMRLRVTRLKRFWVK